jgi:hypothetical protein
MKSPFVKGSLSDFQITLMAYIAIALISTLLVLTLLSVLGHSSEIGQLNTIDKGEKHALTKLTNQSKQRGREIRALKHDTTEIANYATSLAQDIAANHVAASANSAAICAAIPGCTLPAPKPQPQSP